MFRFAQHDKDGPARFNRSALQPASLTEQIAIATVCQLEATL